MVNGIGFQRLIKETLEIGSRSGIIDPAKIIPDPTTISRNISRLADGLREKFKETVVPVCFLKCFCFSIIINLLMFVFRF